MITVTCRICNRNHVIYPDGLGRISFNLAFWFVNMGGSCCGKKDYDPRYWIWEAVNEYCKPTGRGGEK